jgi:ankyrin repeat protein
MKMIDEALNAGAPVDQPDENGNSPLMLSIIKGNVQAARYLLKKGARRDFVNGRNGWTPLFQTVPWDFQEMNDFRKELLEGGADPDVRSKEGITPLMRATWNEPSNPLRQLIECGADLNARDPQGRTALGRALKDGHLKTADFLRLQGATE